MRDKYGVGNDSYCYSNSTTLINKLGILDEDALVVAETEIVLYRVEELHFQCERFDFARLKKIHYHLFQDVYDWAGEVRKVDISKGNTRFCASSRIEAESNKIFSSLESEEWLVNLEPDQFITRLADYFCEINIIHPFREGNGRAQRLFFEELILNADYSVDWSLISRDHWIEANIAGYQCNLTPLINIFKMIIA